MHHGLRVRVRVGVRVRVRVASWPMNLFMFRLLI